MLYFFSFVAQQLHRITAQLRASYVKTISWQKMMKFYLWVQRDWDCEGRAGRLNSSCKSAFFPFKVARTHVFQMLSTLYSRTRSKNRVESGAQRNKKHSQKGNTRTFENSKRWIKNALLSILQTRVLSLQSLFWW